MSNLNKQLRATASSQAAKSDYKSLILAARSALTQGDLELAETLANQADKMGTTVPTWMHPWSDSPAKSAAKPRQPRTKSITSGPNQPPRTKMTILSRPSRTLPSRTIRRRRRHFQWGKLCREPDEQVSSSRRDRPQGHAGHHAQAARDQAGRLHPARSQAEPPVGARRRRPRRPPIIKPVANATARQLMKEAYKALDAGDIAAAQRLAMQAKQQRRLRLA